MRSYLKLFCSQSVSGSSTSRVRWALSHRRASRAAFTRASVRRQRDLFDVNFVWPLAVSCLCVCVIPAHYLFILNLTADGFFGCRLYSSLSSSRRRSFFFFFRLHLSLSPSHGSFPEEAVQTCLPQTWLLASRRCPAAFCCGGPGFL